MLWFNSYLIDHRQRAVLPGAESEWKYIRAGVFQGSVLGPLLFLIYINDIVNEISSNIHLFADDTILYITVNDPLQSATVLNSDLTKITVWGHNWLVTFNPCKTE